MFCSHGRSELNDHWIGLMRGQIDDCECDDRCEMCRASFIWQDERGVDLSGWRNTAEPGAEFCISLTRTGWRDEPCNKRLQSICEIGESKSHTSGGRM